MLASTQKPMLQIGLAIIVCVLAAPESPAAPIAANLSLQYDGADVTTSGGEVLSWNNQGTVGAEGHVVPRLTTARPTVAAAALNGHDVIQFLGRDQEVLRSGLFTTPLAQANMLFVVMRDNGSNSPVIVDGAQSVGGRNFFRPQSNGTFHLYAGTSITQGSSAAKNRYQIYTTLFDQANTRVTTNGAPDFTASASIGTQALGSICIGNSEPNNSHAGLTLTGAIAEVLFYDVPLNGAEQRITENYLSAKYNVGGIVVGSDATLGAYDRYAGDLAANGDYDLEVFGVGRVNALNALTSGNSAGLQIDAIGGLDDEEWVLAGHKSTTNGWVTDNLPADAYARWDRVWYVDATGEVDVRFTFDHGDGGLASLSPGATFGLLYSPTDALDFSFIAMGSVVGDQVTFNLAGGQLQDGYYTLGVPEPSTLLLAALGLLGPCLCGRRRRPSRHSH